MPTFVGRFLPSQQLRTKYWGGGHVFTVSLTRIFLVLSFKYMLRVLKGIYFRLLQAMINRSKNHPVLLSAVYPNKDVEPDKSFMFTSSQMYGICCDCFRKVIGTPVMGDQICESVSFNCRKDFG
jgi:hypothetical protein